MHLAEVNRYMHKNTAAANVHGRNDCIILECHQLIYLSHRKCSKILCLSLLHLAVGCRARVLEYTSLIICLCCRVYIVLLFKCMSFCFQMIVLLCLIRLTFGFDQITSLFLGANDRCVVHYCNGAIEVPGLD